VFIAKIVHGSPAHATGELAIGDELVRIDGFPVTVDTEIFSQRAAAGAKHSFVKLETRHPESADPEQTHEVVLQRGENLEPAPILFMEPTNASIGATTTAQAALLAAEAGLGIVVTVSTSRVASTSSPSEADADAGLAQADSKSEGVRIKEIPTGSAAHVSRVLQRDDIIVRVNDAPVKGLVCRVSLRILWKNV